MSAIPRFFTPVTLKVAHTIELPETVARHVGLARRLRAGTEVCLFNGQGGEYKGTLSFEKKKAYVHITEFNPIERENQTHLTLIQGLASGDKMEWIIEKAVELGVQQLIPIAATHSTLQLKGERAEKRLEKWRNIIISASEQCGRNHLMRLDTIMTLAEALDTLDSHITCIMADPDGTHTMADLHIHTQTNTHSHFAICIGPEGGWSSEELQTTQHHGCKTIQVGPRIFRTETAGLAIGSMLLAKELIG